MKRAATLVLVMLAMSASAAVDARALAHEGQKTQWAPTRNFSSLNARAVFAGESRGATSPYAGEEWETAAGEKDWQYAAGNPTRFTDPSGREPGEEYKGLGVVAGCLGSSLAGGDFGACVAERTEVEAAARRYIYEGYRLGVVSAGAGAHWAAWKWTEAAEGVLSIPTSTPGVYVSTPESRLVASVAGAGVEAIAQAPIGVAGIGLLPETLASTPEALRQSYYQYANADSAPYPDEARLMASVPVIQTGTMVASMAAVLMGPKGPLRGLGSTEVNPLNARAAWGDMWSRIPAGTDGWQLAPIGGQPGPWAPGYQPAPSAPSQLPFVTMAARGFGAKGTIDSGPTAGDRARYKAYKSEKQGKSFKKFWDWFSSSRGGRSGGPGHQAIQDYIASKLGGNSTEVAYGNRFADAAVPGQEIHQIGGMNRRWDPISRERTAVESILTSGQYENERIFFWDKTNPSATQPTLEYVNGVWEPFLGIWR